MPISDYPQLPPADTRIVQAVTYFTNSVDQLSKKMNKLEEAIRLLTRAVEDANNLAMGEDTIRDAGRIDRFKAYQEGLKKPNLYAEGTKKDAS